MTQHVPLTPAAPVLPPARRAELFLLDQCRRLAGSRLTGAAVPADRVLADLRAVLPEAEACRVFGQLYALIARIDREAGDGFLWYPPGATRQSPDEARLIAAAHRLLASTDPRPAGEAASWIGPADEPPPVGRLTSAAGRTLAAATLLPETYCAVADTFCGLLTLTGHACMAACPLQAGARAPGETGTAGPEGPRPGETRVAGAGR
ncbi:hypothetical protein [Prosthecomicrobium hirschii]|uniref:hypothetical protein n=1 Tax=Prosthecodimorpha hirschii TaxID=665126 RepID=UPI002220FD2A|nr:hypothetical protein [Prosthecomicrobium hirschii]MCW1839851.1 hypothetical protein [Prosthecomicrobium hirschii]